MAKHYDRGGDGSMALPKWQEPEWDVATVLGGSGALTGFPTDI